MSEFEEKIEVEGNLSEDDASVGSEVVDDVLSDNEGQGDDEGPGDDDDEFDIDEEEQLEEQGDYEDYDIEGDGSMVLNNNIQINENTSDNSDVVDDEDDDDYEQDLRKFENIEKNNYIENHHQSLLEHNDTEVKALTTIIKDKNGNIIDELHKTLPILTKYEKARILGLRASQINNGAQIFVKPKIKTFDGYLIAIQELEEKKIPFIVKRPLPMGGGCEYWKLDDLEII